MQQTHLLTFDREPMTDQITDNSKAQYGDPMRCIGGYLQAYQCKATYLQWQKWLKDNAITKDHPSVNDSSQKLETWSSLYNLKASQQIDGSLFQASLLQGYSVAALTA